MVKLPDFDKRDYKIDDLVDAKFPMLAESQTLSGMGRFFDVPADVRQAAETYRKELESLPDEEIAGLHEPLRRERAEAAHRARVAEMEKERQRLFFNQPAAIAEFPYWSKIAYWTADEAVALSFSRDPRVVTAENVKCHASLDPLPRRYKAQLEFVTRAVQAGQLSRRFSPATFLAWAGRAGFLLPQQLVDAVKAAPGFVDGTDALDRAASEAREQARLVESLKAEAARREEALAAAERQMQEATSQLSDARQRAEAAEAALAALKAEEVKPKERTSLLTMLLAMAVNGYGYDPKAQRSKETAEIAGDTFKIGLSIEADTVRRYLNEAKELLPPDWDGKHG